MYAEIIPQIKAPRSIQAFDYAIPEDLDIKPGDIVQVEFRKTKITGLVYNLKKSTAFKNIKPILKKLDDLSLPPEQTKLLDWLKEYPNSHIIYDKCCFGGWADNDNSELLPPSNLKEKYPKYNITNGDPNGYNISDYMTFIIDNYDDLPDVTCFLKGNTISRHIRKEIFDHIINNKCFTTIE